MIRAVFLVLLLFWALPNAPAQTVQKEGYKIAKINQEYLDDQGNTTSEIGNLVSKAKYQRQLERSGTYSGIRFCILWKAPSTPTPNLVVKLIARGEDPKTGSETSIIRTHAYPKKQHISGWTFLDITGEDLVRFGKLRSWKVILFQNDQPMAERKSFMWREAESPAEKEPAATEEPSNPAPPDNSSPTPPQP